MRADEIKEPAAAGCIDGGLPAEPKRRLRAELAARALFPAELEGELPKRRPPSVAVAAKNQKTAVRSAGEAEGVVNRIRKRLPRPRRRAARARRAQPARRRRRRTER